MRCQHRHQFYMDYVVKAIVNKTLCLCFWSLQGARNGLFYTTIYKNCSKFKSSKTHFRIRLERKPVRDILSLANAFSTFTRFHLSSASSIKKVFSYSDSFLVSANQLASDVWPSRRVGKLPMAIIIIYPKVKFN